MLSTRSVCAVGFTLTLSAAGLVFGGVEDQAPPAPKIRSEDDTVETLRRGDAYAHLIAAGLAVGRGRGSEAARELDQAVLLAPHSPDLLAQAASLLSMLGRRAEADRFARRALEIDEGQIEAIRVLADLAASRSFGPKADPAARADAIRLYGRLTVEDREAPAEIWLALARLRLASGDNEGAVSAARTLLVRRPGDENALRLLDQCLVAAGRTKEALDVTLAWIKANPDTSDDLLPLVVELARDTGQWTLIEAMCDGMLSENADNARARALRGEARLRQGRPREALDDLELARASSQTDPMVRLHIAAAYQALNRLADATQIAKSLASEYPENTFVRILLAETLSRRGETDEARVQYEVALRGLAGQDGESAARRDEIRLRIAALDLSAKRLDDARAMLSALEKPEAQETLAMRARAALVLGDPKEAKRLAKLLLAPEAVEGALIDAEAELALGRANRAESRFEAAIAKGGAAARGDVAAILRRSGRDAEAETQLRAWIAAAPKDAEARLALGAFLDRKGRNAEAEIELREAIRLDPRLAEALNYLGYSFAERGENLEEALALIKGALDLDPWNGAYLDSLGWVYMKLGRIEDARDPLERAVREFPRDAAVLEHLGDYYDRAGDLGRAKIYWRRALEELEDAPDSIKGRESLEKKIDKVPAAEVPPQNRAALVAPGS